MENNLNIAIGINELTRVLNKNVKGKELSYYFLSVNEYKNVINEIGKAACSDLEQIYENVYYDKKVLEQIDSLINTFKIGNIFLSETVSCKLQYTLQYLNKNFGSENIFKLDYTENTECISLRNNSNNFKYILCEFPECFEKSSSIKIMNEVLKIITLLFDDHKIIILFKRNYNREKASRMLNKKKFDCIYINSFETYLHLVKNSLFLMTDNRQSKKIAESLNKPAILTSDKSRNILLDEIKNIIRNRAEKIA